MKNLLSVLLGMSVGVLAGVCIYRFATSDQGRKMRSDIAQTIRDGSLYLDSLVEKTNDKTAQVGAMMDEKMRDAAHKIEAM